MGTPLYAESLRNAIEHLEKASGYLEDIYDEDSEIVKRMNRNLCRCKRDLKKHDTEALRDWILNS